ncbi:hypothetical protein GCM10023178_16360 [Actinomadura luteofluorescens]
MGGQQGDGRLVTAGQEGGADPRGQPGAARGRGAVWIVHLAASLERPAPRRPDPGEGDPIQPLGISPGQRPSRCGGAVNSYFRLTL